LLRGWWGNIAWGIVGQYYLGVARQFGLVDGGAMWLSGMVGKYGLGDCRAILPRGWWGNLTQGMVGQYG